MPVWLLRVLPLLAQYGSKLGPLAKKAYQSKNFLPALLGAGAAGQMTLSQIGKAGDRKLSREELALQKMLAESQAEATKRSVKESRAQAQEYMKAIEASKKEDRRAAQETALMQSFSQSQDRQMALIMQAIQGISQNRPQPSASPSGMVGLMRSGM